MIRKILFVAAATVAVSVTVFAQGAKNAAPGSKAEKFYQVVPEHEFFFEGFGGFGPLMYKVNAPNNDYALTASVTSSVLWPWKAGDLLTLKNPTGFGYGGGFGYIWHFHPNVGLLLGAEFAVYNGGIDLKDKLYFSSEEVSTENESATLISFISDYAEVQKLMVVQIPLMFHFMAPMGKGNNHFYAAIGAKLGVNVVGKYKVLDRAMQGQNTWDGVNPYYPLDKGTYPYYKAVNPQPSNMYSDDIDERYVKDSFEFRRLNAIGSAELGFRWKLGPGCGLYTGFYVDYGFLGVNKDSGKALHGRTPEPNEPDLTKHNANTPHSILNTNLAPDVRVSYNEDNLPLYEVLPAKQAVTANPLGVGVKLKLSFGKVVKAPAVAPAPPVLPKPDTVVRTIIMRDTVQNTVVVRDTVENTVVVRDTVENTVVVRDTITIIKEVPVEIQQTMRDLSNTLFEFNKFNVGPKAQGYLDEIVDWLVENPKVNVEIGGHTDGIGSQEYNQKLSEQRAKTVYNYLVEHGVNKNRLSYKGYGKTEPIADNSTDAGRQQNRRVELKIIND